MLIICKLQKYRVCSNIEHITMKENKNEYLQVLRKIENNPNTTQRQQAKNLGYSLGKLNYVLQSLKKKRFNQNKKFSKKSKQN